MSDLKNMTDWSGLPDVYVTKAECRQGMFWRIEACSVPMAIGPEVRLIRADLHEAAVAAARAEAYREGWRFAFAQSERTGSVPDPDWKPSEASK